MIAERLARVRERIAGACRRAGRSPDEVTLVAVSKTHPSSAVREAFAAGARAFGENYVQELRRKQDELADLSGAGLEWHFIGRLQTNKARDVVGRVARLHVDRLELARVLSRRAEQAGVTQDVLLQVNLAGEATKAGVAPGEVAATLEALAELPHLRCTGLMTMPPPVDDPEESRPWFRALAELARAHGLRELSMGMTGDFEVAVEEGATIVRVGTAIFGQRGGAPSGSARRGGGEGSQPPST